MEKDLELSEENKDEELGQIVPHIKSLVKKSKTMLKKKREDQKKNEVLEKKQAEEAKYAYTPREGFNWDNVAVAFDEVL